MERQADRRDPAGAAAGAAAWALAGLARDVRLLLSPARPRDAGIDHGSAGGTVELRHLRYFVAVADEQHVGRAARRLRVAQQSVSEQIGGLERELGVALFLRHARGVTLTRAGGELLHHARDVLARAQAAVEHVRRVGREGTRLRVGVLDCGAGSAAFAGAVAAFRARYAHVILELDPMPLPAHTPAVVGGQLDVGFAVGGAPGAGAPPLPDMRAERVVEDALAGVLLPSAHPLAGEPCVDPAALAALPCIDFPAARMPEKHAEDVARLRAAGWRGRVAYEVESFAAILSMVAAGAGWKHVTPWGAAAPRPEVTYRPLCGGTGAPVHTYALHREADGDPLVRAFLAELEAAGALA